MDKIKYYMVSKQMFCEVRNPVTNNIAVFSTNNLGRGLWIGVYCCETLDVIVERQQIEGTTQFSIEGLKHNSQKSKMRKYIKRYFELYFGAIGDE
ncbi:MAG: hypothetical protein II013_04475 [Lachnobacterium sp.]|nr:hypothetical protein [Lachnobacterium sp.]